jgi:hypothetical protein
VSWYVAFDNGDRTDVLFYPPEEKREAIEIARQIKVRGFRVREIADIDESEESICGDELDQLLQPKR